jgi:predicted permease
MNHVLQDIRFAWRIMLRTPVISVVILLSLALGIGINIAVFTVLNAVFIRPLPVRDVDRLVQIFTVDQINHLGELPTSYANFQDYRDNNTIFSGMAVDATVPVLLNGQVTAKQINAEIVSGNYFDLLGVEAAIGRVFTESEDKVAGGDPYVVISDGFWRRDFGANPSALGHDINLNGYSFRIIGILPPGFTGTNVLASPDIFVPIMMHDQVFGALGTKMFQMRRALQFRIFARLKPEANLAAAKSQMVSLAASLQQLFPVENRNRSADVIPLLISRVDPNRRSQYVRIGSILSIVVGIVLLITCINIANLLMMRAAQREKEIAVRLALGVSRSRLLRQFMVESFMVAIPGGCLGLALAFSGRTLLWSLRPQELQQVNLNLTFDVRLLTVVALIILATAIFFGFGPAVHLVNSKLITALREKGGLGGVSWWRDALIFAEVTLSIIILAGAAFFLVSLRNAQNVNVGFSEQKLLLTSFDLEMLHYDEPRAQQFIRTLCDKVQTLPGVQSVTVANAAPLLLGVSVQLTVFPVNGDPNLAKGQLTPITSVGPHYFKTMGIPLIAGRDFDEGDVENRPHVAIINETAAAQFWPNQDAIGKQYKYFGSDELTQVVGIVKKGKYSRIGEDPRSYMYVPIAQQHLPGKTFLSVRTIGDPNALGMSVRSAIHDLDSNLPILDMTTMTDVVHQALWAPRIGAIMVGSFALLTLLLASMGLYGVVASFVRQKTQEIGVRLALGASTLNILKFVLGRTMMIAMIGSAVGLVVTILGSRLISGLLYELHGTESLIYALVVIFLLFFVACTALIPAWAATKIDPIKSLRCE